MSEEKLYRVREGVEWVNGARVPADRLVRLTAEQARFDLDQGRISLVKEDIPDVGARCATSVYAGEAPCVPPGSGKGRNKKRRGHGRD